MDMMASSGERSHKQIYAKLKGARVVEASFNPMNHADSYLISDFAKLHLISLSILLIISIWTGFAKGFIGIKFMNSLYVSSLTLIFAVFISGFLFQATNDFMLLHNLRIVERADDSRE